MVEINDPDSFQVLGPPQTGEERGRHEVVGEVELSGELLDTKCFLG